MRGKPSMGGEGIAEVLGGEGGKSEKTLTFTCRAKRGKPSMTNCGRGAFIALVLGGGAGGVRCWAGRHRSKGSGVQDVHLKCAETGVKCNSLQAGEPNVTVCRRESQIGGEEGAGKGGALTPNARPAIWSSVHAGMTSIPPARATCERRPRGDVSVAAGAAAAGRLLSDGLRRTEHHQMD
eukprot:361308-Chlamydomonas_euryale.AAC.1